MRLISFGSSQRAQIVLHSQYVSGYHAELIQLDNGDMLLVDKSSSNGTFVNGNRITPEKEVTVTRNDTISFADQVLNWQTVPPLQIPDKDKIKSIKGIGSHYLNAIHITGDHVSRFHATIKQNKDGKWYICDHSTNGTTVNGNRIPKDQYVQIKKGDAIACAGTAIVNPVTGGGNGNNALKIAAIAICAFLVLCVGGIIAYMSSSWSEKKLYKTYASSTVMLHSTYYFKITTSRYGVERFIVDPENGIDVYDGTNAMHALATGFFISNDGVIVTNLHVTSPWLFGDEKDLLQAIKTIYHRKFNIAMADITVEGAIVSIEAVPNGKLFDEANATKLHKITESETTDIDLAVLQTIDNKIIPGSTYIPLNKFRVENVLVGEKIYTMGFPGPGLLQDLGEFEKDLTKVLQATGAGGEITMNNDAYTYGFNAPTLPGASGSPIFDKNGNLVSIVSMKLANTQGYNFSVKVKHLQRMIDKMKENSVN